jgi:hypothetical protein
MEDLTIRQRKRIKKALKIMRKSSEIKYEVLRDLHGFDPSRIEERDSFPKMATIINYNTYVKGAQDGYFS